MLNEIAITPLTGGVLLYRCNLFAGTNLLYTLDIIVIMIIMNETRERSDMVKKLYRTIRVREETAKDLEVIAGILAQSRGEKQDLSQAADYAAKLAKFMEIVDDGNAPSPAHLKPNHDPVHDYYNRIYNFKYEVERTNQVK